MRAAVWAALGISALALGGCDFITSSTPMFSAAAARWQAQPRPGVWMDEHQSCDFDASTPIDT